MSALYKLMRRLDSLASEEPIFEEKVEVDGAVFPSEVSDGEDFGLNVFDTDYGPTVYPLPEQKNAAAVQRVSSVVKERSAASLRWNTKWSRDRNISQLLSNGMRMRADELGLKFRADGYVLASLFITAVEKLKILPREVHLTCDMLEEVILGDQGIGQGIRNDERPQTGKGERHQFVKEHGQLYIRCMQGHLSKYYGDGDGLIDVNRIFKKLDAEANHLVYHDTDLECKEGIDILGLLSNPAGGSDGGRFVHLYVTDGSKQGRANKALTYTIDVKAAVAGGVKFYQADNDVVLVEHCVPPAFLIECNIKTIKHGWANYAPFGVLTSSADSVFLDFATDVLNLRGVNTRLHTLWHVIRPTVEQRLMAVSKSLRDSYSVLSYALVNDPPAQHKVVLNIGAYLHGATKIHLLMLNGKNDGNLVALGNRYGFPRGCLVLWRKGVSIDLRGFYPKFANDKKDERDAVSFDYSLLSGAMSLDFFRKWSGFLLHIIGFECDSVVYWTVCSKKSADPGSVFVKNGRDVVGPLLDTNTKLLRILARGHLYLGGEALHVEDEHGYVARSNDVVITCVGTGLFHASSDLVDSVSKPVADMLLMHHQTSSGVASFCSEHNLKCDSAFTFNADEEGLRNAMVRLLENRDLLRNSTFEEIISKFDGEGIVQRISGHADHEALVGDVLEGFVFHVNKFGGVRETVKVKLPFYTWRTMFLREWLGTVLEPGSVSVEGKQYVTADCANRIDAFVRRWCFTSKGRALFQKLLKCAAVKLQTQWSSILLGDLESVGGVVSKRVHVIIADVVENLYFSGGLNVIEKEATEFDAILDADKLGIGGFPDNIVSIETLPITVCLCVGPVGAGKSTFMNRLYQTNPSKFELIDGDNVVGFDIRKGVESLTPRQASELTLTLGTERNPVTLSRMWEAVMNGKIPLISHGGMCFVKHYTDGREPSVVCNLRRRVREVFAADLNLVVVLMRDSSRESDSTRSSIMAVDKHGVETVVKGVFDGADYSYMSQVHVNRSESGEWDRFPLGKDKKAERTHIEKFVSVTKANYVAALAIARVGDHVFSAPFQTGRKDDWINSIEQSVGLDSIRMCLSANMYRPGIFQQLRLIMKEHIVGGGEEWWAGGKCKHLTLEFGEFECNSMRLLSLAHKFDGHSFTGDRYLMTFHKQSAVKFDVSKARTDKIGGVKVGKARDAEWFDVCKTVSVVHMPNFTDCCTVEHSPHITERTGDFNPRDSVNIIKYLEGPSSATHTMLCKGDEYVFDSRKDGVTYYEPLTTGDVIRSQTPVHIRANYVNGTEQVTYRCIGVAVFGNEDTR